MSVGSSSWLHPQHLGQCLPLQLKKELPDCPLAYFALSLSPSFHTVLSAWAFGSCTSQTPWRTGFLNHPIRPKGRKKIKEGRRGPAGAPPVAVQAPLSPHTLSQSTVPHFGFQQELWGHQPLYQPHTWLPLGSGHCTSLSASQS